MYKLYKLDYASNSPGESKNIYVDEDNKFLWSKNEVFGLKRGFYVTPSVRHFVLLINSEEYLEKTEIDFQRQILWSKHNNIAGTWQISSSSSEPEFKISFFQKFWWQIEEIELSILRRYANGLSGKTIYLVWALKSFYQLWKSLPSRTDIQSLETKTKHKQSLSSHKSFIS